MGNGVSANFVVTRDRKLGSFVTRHLQNHIGEAQLKNDLQSDQASECVVISLLRGGKESCNQSNSDKAGCTGPESRKHRESYRPIKPKHPSYPVTETHHSRWIQLERRQLWQTLRHSVPSRSETATRPT